MHIKIKKGLDIPIIGKPEGSIQKLQPSGQSSTIEHFNHIALDFSPFDNTQFVLLKKLGDTVSIGEPVALDKNNDYRKLVSPASGVIKAIHRGLKRRLLSMVIEVKQHEDIFEHPPLNPNHASREELLDRLYEGGAMFFIRERPFCLLPTKEKKPSAIFIKALESAPFVPPAEYQLEGYESEFKLGLEVLKKLTDGKVHLVRAMNAVHSLLIGQEGITYHTAEGPHPISNPSLHIQHISPIRSAEEVVWTLNVRDVITVGSLVGKGKYPIDRVIGIGGPGILEGKTGYFRVREGIPVSALIAGRLIKQPMRLISGDPLMGHKVEPDGFLGILDYAFSAIPENRTREFLHFFRLGFDKYSFSRAYASGHMNPEKTEFDFTTNMHGEHRAFIDPTLYQKVQPLRIPTMQLVKAVMAEDFDLAEELGLLEVAPEDFALTTFVCPSKIEMVEIIKDGLRKYSKEMS